MKRTHLTIAALLVATIAAGAAAPAFAQQAAPSPNANGPRELHLRGAGGEHQFAMRRDGGREDGMRRGVRRGGSGMLALVCSEDGADRLEHLLLNMKQRTDPTAEQQPLFDALQSAALTAQADFAATCTAARPASDQAATTDLVERMKTGLEIQQAHLDAMNAVLPAFEAYFDSLSDEQKQSLVPHERDGKRSGHRFERRMHAPGQPAPQEG